MYILVQYRRGRKKAIVTSPRYYVWFLVTTLPLGLRIVRKLAYGRPPRTIGQAWFTLSLWESARVTDGNVNLFY